MEDRNILTDEDFLTNRQFSTYDIIVKKMQINWRYQLTIVIIGLGFIYNPDNSARLLNYIKIPADTFFLFTAYILPITFIYFGFFLGRYISARTSIEHMLLNKEYVPDRHEAAKLTDGLTIFDITHRLIVLKLPIVAKITHGIACLFVIIVVVCNHVLSFKFALEADLFSITGRYISNFFMCTAILLCYLHFILQLPSLVEEAYIDKIYMYKFFCYLSILLTICVLLWIYAF